MNLGVAAGVVVVDVVAPESRPVVRAMARRVALKGLQKRPHAAAPVALDHLGRDVAVLLVDGAGVADVHVHAVGRLRQLLLAEELVELYGARFRDDAPLSAADAAAQIIAGVVRGETRILIGEDAVVIDWLARAFPQLVYKDWFIVGVLAPWSLSAAMIGRKYRGRYWFPLVVAACAYAAKCVAARGVRGLRSRL